MTTIDPKNLLSQLSKEEYCYLTTRGRKTGNPHEIEIWFGLDGKTIYLLSGGRDKSDWVKNLLNDPRVTTRIGQHTFTAIARLVNEEKEESTARYLLAEKYQGWQYGKPLSEWAQTALVVALNLNLPAKN